MATETAPHLAEPTAPDTGAPGRRTVTVLLDDSVTRRVGRLLASVVAVLGVLEVLALVVRHGLGHEYVYGFRDLIDLNKEGSLGTWVAGLLLVSLAVLAALCGVDDARQGGRWRRNWHLLAVALAYVSADELLAIHERVSILTQQALDTDGALLFAWVIPAAVLVAVFGLVQLRFFLHLPAATRRSLAVAAGVFLLAAMGLEVVESAVFASAGEQTLLFDSLSGVEELMELSAVALAVTALLRHLTRPAEALVLGGWSAASPWPDGQR